MKERLQLFHQAVAQTRLKFTIFKFNFCSQDNFGNRTQPKKTEKKEAARVYDSARQSCAVGASQEEGNSTLLFFETERIPPASSKFIQ